MPAIPETLAVTIAPLQVYCTIEAGRLGVGPNSYDPETMNPKH